MATQDMRAFTDGAVDQQDEGEQATRAALRNQISFGMDMEIFLRSDVGRYLDTRASVEIDTLRKRLDDIDATDATAIRVVQLEIAARKIWKDWIVAAIQDGQSAQEIALERNVL